MRVAVFEWSRWLFVVALLSIGLHVPAGALAWTVWLSRQPGAPGAFRVLVHVAFGLVALIALQTAISLLHVWAALFTGEPAEKATLLAKGISETMNCLAFGVVLSGGFSTVLGVLTVWHARRRRGDAA